MYFGSGSSSSMAACIVAQFAKQVIIDVTALFNGSKSSSIVTCLRLFHKGLSLYVCYSPSGFEGRIGDLV